MSLSLSLHAVYYLCSLVVCPIAVLESYFLMQSMQALNRNFTQWRILSLKIDMIHT